MSIRRAIFGLNLKKVTFAELGFHSGCENTKKTLELVVETFARSYNLALDSGDPEETATKIDAQVEPDLRGFAHEAAAMAFTVIDMSRFGRSRFLREYSENVRPDYAYLEYVGAGVACGALRRSCKRLRARLDPFTSWLVLDGRGFYDAFFRTSRTIGKKHVPRDLDAQSLQQYDAGIGRGLWFIECGDPQRLLETTSAFSNSRQPHVWAGLGLAVAYAGGVEGSVISELVSVSGQHREMLAQGVAIAAHARHRAGNNASHVDMASQVVWGCSSLELHQLAEKCIAQVHDVAFRRGETETEAVAEPLWFSFTNRLKQHFEEQHLDGLSRTENSDTCVESIL